MITTNSGAKKIENNDNWREIFDAHNDSVDAADRIQPEIAPIINGKQCALGAASGDYVLLRNSTITGKSDGAYQATKAIPANTDLDSTYLGSPITGGMVNELNNNLTSLSDQIESNTYSTNGLTTNNCSIDAGGYHKLGKLVVVNIRLATTSGSFSVSGFPTYSSQISKNIVACTINNIGDAAIDYELFAYISRTGALSCFGASNKTYAIFSVYMCD